MAAKSVKSTWPLSSVSKPTTSKPKSDLGDILNKRKLGKTDDNIFDKKPAKKANVPFFIVFSYSLPYTGCSHVHWRKMKDLSFKGKTILVQRQLKRRTQLTASHRINQQSQPTQQQTRRKTKWPLFVVASRVSVD